MLLLRATPGPHASVNVLAGLVPVFGWKFSRKIKALANGLKTSQKNSLKNMHTAQ
jgi:hypothetical protein